MPGCVKKQDDWLPPRPKTASKEEKKSRAAVHVGHPQVDGRGVRDWFATVRFKGWRRLSIFSEFHPDEGSFVARYGKGAKVFYLSYIDNQRMSQFGLRRDAREMLQVGRSALPREQSVAGRTWYAVEDDHPLLATDVTEDIKLVLMGYQGVKLEELLELAAALPVDALKTKAES